MIVVKYGNPENFGTEVTCPKCASDFLYNKKDVKIEREQSIAASINIKNEMNYSELEYTICPVCGYKIPLKRYWYTNIEDMNNHEAIREKCRKLKDAIIQEKKNLKNS